MKKYTSYKLMLKTPCCNKTIQVGLYDYFYNVNERKKLLILVFGNKRVFVKKIKNVE